MKLKKKEFHELKQGAMSVSEYVAKFTQLSRYAPEDVDTDEKKQEHFLEGLNDGIQYALLPQDFASFQVMVNKALVVEHKRRQMEHKRKMSSQGQGSSSRFRPRYNPPQQGPMFRQQNQHQNQNKLQMQAQRSNFQAPRQTQPPTPQQKFGDQAPSTGKACFVCGEVGHYANKCPRKKPSNSPVQHGNGYAPKQGQHQAPGRNGNPAPAPTNRAQQNYARGRINHVTTEEVQGAQDVVLGMFLVNSNPASVLFDSGASHSFITARYVSKYNLPIVHMKQQMIISSPGGEMRAKVYMLKAKPLYKGGRFLNQPCSSGIQWN